MTSSDPATFGDPLTFNNANDIMLMSPSKCKDVVSHSTHTAPNPSEGRTTEVIAVMMSLRMVTPANAATSTESKR
jgi:hypothetical protein